MQHAAIESMEKRVLLATFVVTSTNDSGAGTLRQAILDANAAAGADVINFNIGSGAASIAPTSALPAITDTLAIAGETQAGFAGAPLIELTGFNEPAGTIGLDIQTHDCNIRSLVINSFPGDGIRISGATSRFNSVQGCYIGLVALGTAASGNGGFGIEIDGINGNLIGGVNAAQRNIISGNGGGAGITIHGAGAYGNVVQGNYIGTNARGTLPIGNIGAGVTISGGAANNRIGGDSAKKRNIISGNSANGVLITNPGSSGNVVQGNFIGTTARGGAALPNATGVEIRDGASINLIGGTGAKFRNVISGNVNAGTLLDGIETAGNLVWGNFIGTDPTGARAIANGLSGISLSDAANGNGIGNRAAGRGNLISGNPIGILISDDGTEGNVIRHNVIGTDVTGTLPLPNTGDGIFIQTSSANIVGGSRKGSANIIAFNGGTGIRVSGGDGNFFSRNAIHDNGGLGIDLDPLGITAGYPVLTSALRSTGAVTISGTFSGAASSAYLIEFFDSPAVDPSGFGEGQTFIGGLIVTTNASGNVAFTTTLLVTLPKGHVVTATASDSNNSTSEFSNAAGFGIINGNVFNDANGNSVHDIGEAGLAGFQIYIDANDDGSFDLGELGVRSDADGNYTFVVPAGTYRVREVAVFSYTQTLGAAGDSLKVSSTKSGIGHFGNQPIT